MNHSSHGHLPFLIALVLVASNSVLAAPLTVARDHNWLIIQGTNIPGREIRINYLEAYCRPNSADADWIKHTVIRHTNETISMSDDHTLLRMRDRLEDG